MQRYDVPIRTLHFTPGESPVEVPTVITEMEKHAMALGFDFAEEALREGNPPVGAVLIDHESGQLWGAKTDDKTSGDILGHAELRAYGLAKETVGSELDNCTLVTTAQPCNTCTSPYAEGKIGKIIYAAPRKKIFEVSGIMRARRINMDDLLEDGHTDTYVTEGYESERSLDLFAVYGILRATRVSQETSKAIS
jgi:tRNA(adenine34) deaminase